MPVRYIDFNRGSDANNGSTPALAWKNLSMAANFNPGAGGGLYLASDSIWEISPTRAAHNSSVQTQFRGVSGSPAFIAPYDPVANTTGSMPTIRYRMFPTASDWTWDATDNWGFPKGWYIQLDWNNLTNDILVMVGGQWVGTTNQRSTGNKGYGSINGDYEGSYQGQFVNGMTRNTLRFNIDLGGANVGGKTTTRLYLSGAGLLTPGAGNDPSSVYGPGAIMIGFRPFFYLYNSDTHLQVTGIRCEDGGGLFAVDGDANRLSTGFEAWGNDFRRTGLPMTIISASGAAATTRREIDVHHNTGQQIAGSFFSAFKFGITGRSHHNYATDGNKCSAMGGAEYIQVATTTANGYREPFISEHNHYDRWANGTGNNTFDGGGLYVDIGDDGSILRYNLVTNSYVAFQCGSGALSHWYGNTSINCELFGMWNNPGDLPAFLASDYRIEHNLHIGAPLGTFPHGQDTGVSPAVTVITYNGANSNLVGVGYRNNTVILADGDTRSAANIMTSADWATNKVRVDKNAVAGGSVKAITSDVGATDRTASTNTLVTTREAIGLIPDGQLYKISTASSLWSAGVDLARINEDRTGRRYYSPPSIGPFEQMRPASYFWAMP